MLAMPGDDGRSLPMRGNAPRSQVINQSMNQSISQSIGHSGNE
jgi:hypothetical protein